MCRLRLDTNIVDTVSASIDARAFKVFNGKVVAYDATSGMFLNIDIDTTTNDFSINFPCTSFSSTGSNFSNMPVVTDSAYLLFKNNKILSYNKSNECRVVSTDVTINATLPDSYINSQAGVAVIGNYAYFSGYSNSTGLQKLYRTDGASMERVSNTNPGADDVSWLPAGATAIDGYVYFGSRNSSGHAKLYRFNPIRNSVEQISNINSNNNDFDLTWGCTGVYPSFVKLSGNIYFNAFSNWGSCSSDLYRLEGALPAS